LFLKESSISAPGSDLWISGFGAAGIPFTEASKQGAPAESNRQTTTGFMPVETKPPQPQAG
jgi:hypothetical protein